MAKEKECVAKALPKASSGAAGAAFILQVAAIVLVLAWAGGFLDGVNVASLGLMAVVTWQLARAALVDAVTAGLGLVAAGLLFWLPVNSAWLVLGGAGLGLAVKLLL